MSSGEGPVHLKIRLATSGFECFDFTVSRSWQTSLTVKEGYSSSFFVRNADERHAVIQEATDWIEIKQASLQESNDLKAQTIWQKAAQAAIGSVGIRK